jgi:hypothetical protein
MSTRAAGVQRSGCFYRVAALGALPLACVCACSQPDAARSDVRGPGDQFDPGVVLEGNSARAAEQGMLAAAEGYRPRPLVPAADGVRWGDVPMAIRNVADASFVGVRSVDTSADRIVANTVLEDGQRGTVAAVRDEAGAITFECRLSTFADAKRDGAFDAAVRKELLRLGALRRPQP